ncbi:MAG: hypothetical protein GY780_00220 [bacterium]|nr:hypothetical protein [bacterium]
MKGLTNIGILPATLVLLFGLPAGLVFGQAEVVNPHGKMDVSCIICHTEQSWQIDKKINDFDHSGAGFVLEGLHAHALCRDCHREPVFSHVGTSCADCHDDFHRGRLGADCENCHTPDGWVDRSVMQQEHDNTALPLVGAHTQVDCDACHSGAITSQYVGTPSACFACHQDDFDQTSNPNHTSVGFGYDCETCHTFFANTWGSGDFQHPSSFPLTAGHGNLECSSCHENGFQSVPADCYSCHQPDYESADDPDHFSAAFPTDCTQCHNTTTWSGATFDHNNTTFPLTGAHTPLDCTACHSAGYTGTPDGCFDCHQSDYEETNDPGHTAAGFPEDCLSCHTTSAWEPSTWNHDLLFPIYSGKHRQEWNSCTDCHEVPSDFGLFECIHCHEHNRSDTDNDHSEVDDYQYLSTRCFDCHPQGDD